MGLSDSFAQNICDMLSTHLSPGGLDCPIPCAESSQCCECPVTPPHLVTVGGHLLEGTLSGRDLFHTALREPADVPRNLLVLLALPPISHGGSVIYRTNIVCVRIRLVQASLEVPL